MRIQGNQPRRTGSFDFGVLPLSNPTKWICLRGEHFRRHSTGNRGPRSDRGFASQPPEQRPEVLQGPEIHRRESVPFEQPRKSGGPGSRDWHPEERAGENLREVLPVWRRSGTQHQRIGAGSIPGAAHCAGARRGRAGGKRSEEHTAELQSRLHLVCRLLLEKKKKKKK